MDTSSARQILQETGEAVRASQQPSSMRPRQWSNLRRPVDKRRAILHRQENLLLLNTRFMVNDGRYTTEIARLHGEAAECRLQAVEAQLELASTICQLAEEIRYSRPDEAIKVVNKLRHHVETIALHIDEPNHLPSSATPGLRKQVTELKNRIDEIESSIRLPR